MSASLYNLKYFNIKYNSFNSGIQNGKENVLSHFKTS